MLLEKLERVLATSVNMDLENAIEYINNSFRSFPEISERLEARNKISNPEIRIKGLRAVLQDEIYAIKTKEETARKIADNKAKTQNFIAQINAINCNI